MADKVASCLVILVYISIAQGKYIYLAICLIISNISIFLSVSVFSILNIFFLYSLSLCQSSQLLENHFPTH